jgi:succinate dehydrogenase flavin-adding protein (antitoxin of CptAB toxin-antitoxin module)
MGQKRGINDQDAVFYHFMKHAVHAAFDDKTQQ